MQADLLRNRGRLEPAGITALYPEGAEDVVDLLVVATDGYTWKLRRDLRLTRAETEDRIRTLVAAVLARGG